jgi:hypothetical protein
VQELAGDRLRDTLGALVKYQDDAALAQAHLDELLARAQAAP